ncbi:ABC transporter permease [Dietzia sp. UBA5065]|uniref:MlaE family ABC transporter permease n=1 Tax=Dietzia sp. UBA5065 TaxID=1946422 RepID=UPI0025BEA50A|nr:ABC transporter permease [Dietzia sp. UBA5065]HMT48715.1 ABC transporter permease [Dietzia sp.]
MISLRETSLRATTGLAEVGRHVTFAGRVLATLPTALVRYRRQVVKEVVDVGFGSTSLIAGGGTIGIVLAMSAVAAIMVGVETYRGLDLIGMTTLSGMLSAMANTRELAPVVASIALAAKVGTGFTARLGSMRISDEIDALDAMSVPTVPYLAGTRVIATMICIVPLYAVGLVATYIATRVVVVHVNGGSAGTYDHFFHITLGPEDVLYSLIKAVVFALVIVLVHCSYGYHATGGPEGVGRAAGRALRTSILLIGFIDIVLTFALWGLVPEVPALGIT